METAVSKLCCPACYDYFDILSKKHRRLGDNEETKMYNIRGRHSTVYPVQLPRWSCPAIVQELIRRFGKYLHDELDEMWTRNDKQMKQNEHLEKLQKFGHGHSPSLQSVSSAITDASRGSAETDLGSSALPLQLPALVMQNIHRRIIDVQVRDVA